MTILRKCMHPALAASALFAVACVVDTSSRSHDRDPAGIDVTGNPASGGGPGSGATSGDGGPSSSPLLVDVDTDAQLKVDAGQGAGVFVEYGSGGHWRVSWACDTGINPAHVCAYALQFKAVSGTLANLDASSLPAGAAVQSGPNPLSVTMTSSTEVDTITFDTDAGAVLSVDATLDGQHTGQLFFFVRNGKVNGGFTGPLSDPLLLQGATP